MQTSPISSESAAPRVSAQRPFDVALNRLYKKRLQRVQLLVHLKQLNHARVKGVQGLALPQAKTPRPVTS